MIISSNKQKKLTILTNKKNYLKNLNSIKPLNSAALKTDIKKTDKGSNVFYNYTFDKGRIKSLVSWSLKTYGEYKTIHLLENLKKIGFEYATKAGISLGVEDLKIPPKKALLLYEAEEISKKAMDQYNRAEITGVERFQRLIDTWHRTSEQLKQEVIDHFENTDVLNPVYMMAFSGARGNISQVRQLVGMRGLMADPKGQIIDYPIRSNFREGLTLTEYIISTYGARKGIVDTALRTANAGYLTRRLVDVAQHVVISNYDCGTEKGIFLNDMKEGTKTIYSLQTRLVGRVLARDIFKTVPKSSDYNLITNSKEKADSNFSNFIKIKLASRNQEISPDLAFDITKNVSSKKVFVRSPLTCETKKLICQLCYGWSLAQGNLVSIGEAVGIVAAQSIGEPGTQLTMRTFHTGGVFSGDISDQIRAPYNGQVHYFEQMAGTLIRTPEGKMAFLTKIDGSLCVYTKEIDISQAKVYKIPAYTILYFKNGEHVIEKQVIGQISTIARQQNMRDDSELTVKSQIQGQFFVKTLQLEEKLIGPKVKKTDIEPSMTPLFMNKVMTSWDWGYAWILSCKLYKMPIFNSSNALIPEYQLLPKAGDFVDTNSIMSQIQWILPANGGQFTSFEAKKASLQQNTLQWNSNNNKQFLKTSQNLSLKTNGSSYYKYNQGTALQRFLKKENNLFNKIDIKKNLIFFDLQKIMFKKTGYFLENPDFLIFLPTNLKGFNQKNYPNVHFTSSHNIKDKPQNLTTLFKPISEQSHFFGIQVFPKNGFVKNSSNSYLMSSNALNIGQSLSSTGKSLLTSEKVFLNYYKGFKSVDQNILTVLSQKISTKISKVQFNIINQLFKDQLNIDFKVPNSPQANLSSTKFKSYDFTTLVKSDTKNLKNKLSEIQEPGLPKNYLLFKTLSKVDLNQKNTLNKQVLMNNSLNFNKGDLTIPVDSQRLIFGQLNKSVQGTNLSKTSFVNSVTTIKTNNIKSKMLNNGKKLNANSTVANDFIFFNNLRNRIKPTNGFTNFSVFKDINSLEISNSNKTQNYNFLTIKSDLSKTNNHIIKSELNILTLLENNYLLVDNLILQRLNNSNSYKKASFMITKIKQKIMTPFQKDLLETLDTPKYKNVFLHAYYTELTFSKLSSKSQKYSKAFNTLCDNNINRLAANHIGDNKNFKNNEKWVNLVLNSNHIKTMASLKLFNLKSTDLGLTNIKKDSQLNLVYSSEQGNQKQTKNMFCLKNTLKCLKISQSKNKVLKNKTWNRELSIFPFVYKTFNKRASLYFDKKYLLEGFHFKLTHTSSPIIFDKNNIFTTVINADITLKAYENAVIGFPSIHNSKKSAVEEWLEARINKKNKDKEFNSNTDKNSQPESQNQQSSLPKLKWYINPKPRFLPAEILKKSKNKAVENSLEKNSSDHLAQNNVNKFLKSTYIQFNKVNYSNYNSNYVESNVSTSKLNIKVQHEQNSKSSNYNSVVLNKLVLNQNTKIKQQFVFEKLNLVKTKLIKPLNYVLTIKDKQNKLLVSPNTKQSSLLNGKQINLQTKNYIILFKQPFSNNSVFGNKQRTSQEPLLDIQNHVFRIIVNKQASSYNPIAKIPNANLLILPYLNNSNTNNLKQTNTVEFPVTNNTFFTKKFYDSSSFSQIPYQEKSISNKEKSKAITNKSKKVGQKQNNIILNKTAKSKLAFSSQTLTKNLISIKPTSNNNNNSNIIKAGQMRLNEILKIESFTTPDYILSMKPISLNSFVITYNIPALFEYQFKKLDINLSHFANSHLFIGHLQTKYKHNYNNQLGQLFTNLLQLTTYSKKNIEMQPNQVENLKKAKPVLNSYNKQFILGLVNQSCFEMNLKCKYRNYKYGLSPIDNTVCAKRNQKIKKSQVNWLFSSINKNNPNSILSLNSETSAKYSSDWESLSNKSELGLHLANLKNRSNKKFYKTECVVNFDNVSNALNALSKTSFLATYSGEIIKQPSYKNNFNLFPQEQTWKSQNQKQPTIMDLLHIGNPATPMSSIQKQTMLNNNNNCLFLTKKDLVSYKLTNLTKTSITSNIAKNVSKQRVINPLKITTLNSQLTKIQSNWVQKKQTVKLVNFNTLERPDFNNISPSTVGSFILRGDIAQKEINSNVSVTPPKVYNSAGQIIHMNTAAITVRKAQPILISAKTTFHAYHGDFVLSKEPVITLIYQKLKTGDIIQGIPKVEQFFEARTTKRGRLFRDNLPNLLKGLFIKYYVYSLKLLKQGFTESNFMEINTIQKVSESSILSSKMDYSHVALKWAVKQSFYKIQQIAVDGVLRVYRSQGVTISDKHLEIIVKQMTTKVRVIQGGQTGFFPGEIVDLDFVETINSVLIGGVGKKVQYEPIILGITKASLQVDSFLSSASFQQTARILSQSALFNKKDFLKGVKENVILGNLIPAGTGYLVSLSG